MASRREMSTPQHSCKEYGTLYFLPYYINPTAAIVRAVCT